MKQRSDLRSLLDSVRAQMVTVKRWRSYPTVEQSDADVTFRGKRYVGWDPDEWDSDTLRQKPMNANLEGKPYAMWCKNEVWAAVQETRNA